MRTHERRTASEDQARWGWRLSAALMGILTLSAAQAQAQVNLDIERAGHPTTVSTETHGAFLEYGIKATGNTQAAFCSNTDQFSQCTDEGLDATDDEHTVTYAVETAWTRTRSGGPLPSRTQGGVNGATARTKGRGVNDIWWWDQRQGLIGAHEDRPLQATMTLVEVESGHNIGPNNTLKFNVNPQISIENAEATEGTDANLVFKVTLLPPALETTTANYISIAATATGGGVDYSDVSGTLTWTAGQSIKYINVPIVDDGVDDSGEEMLLNLNNASGVTRFVQREGYYSNGRYIPTDFQPGVGAIGTIRNDEPGPTDSVEKLPVVSIEADAEYETEGSSASFTLSRTGETTEALTANLTVTEDGEMLADTTPTTATFAAGAATTTVEVGTVGDETDEPDSKVTVTVETGDGYKLGDNTSSEARTTILDDDAASLPGGTVAVEGTTIWTADMTVTDYGNGNVGAGSAGLLANQRGSAGLQARWLYYETEPRRLRMAFTTGVDTGELTVAAGNVKLAFPENTSGDSSFSWNNVDVDWSDGQTFEARLVRGEREATEAPDPTLKSLTISDVTLSPAFDPEKVAYTATVDAETTSVTLAATANDDDAAVAYDPATDADGDAAGHQIAVAVGETVATVTVTAADGETTRAYRVVVTRPAPQVTNNAPTGAPSISGTAKVDEKLTASIAGIADEDGTDNATFAYQWISNNGSDSDIAGATGSSYTVKAADVGKTIKVRVTFTDDGGNEESLLSAATETVVAKDEPEVEETTPTVSIAGGSGKEGDDDEIDFTVTLDEAASETVTVDYETSDGSAEAGDDYTAKSGTLSFSAGQTSKTISVEIEDDIENESDETFTVTLSNASGADLGTSSATGTIRNRHVEPLTASFSDMPDEHDGTVFYFDLSFSENVAAGYAKVRDAFSVDGGKANEAKRKTQGSNQNWTIRVKPHGSGSVSITLPATTSCSAAKAICTDDGRKLSGSTSATVLGPVGISISDVEVEEAAGAVLTFSVALTRAASSQLTVDYATSDGTATAGADYTARSGTLTIGAGSSSGSIEVSVLDDDHNEGSETFTVTLSNASSGQITDATATGTITNHDALPAALVARFGRTAALHVVEQVEERVNAPRAPGFDGRVAGREINRDMGRDVALDFVRQLGGGYGRHEQAAGSAMTAAGGTDPRLGNGGMTSSLGPQDRSGAPMGSGSMQGLHPAQAYEHSMGMGLGRNRLLEGSSFALNRATSNGGVLSFWSRSASSQFYGQDGALALNGDVRSTMFGADYSKGRMITGVSLAHSRGLGSYAGVDTGQMTSAVTGLYPWIGYKASERVTVWTVTGYGAGGLMLNPSAGTPIETGLSMAMAAGGGRGEILGDGEGFALAVKADALWVGTRTQAANGVGGKLKATSAAVNRVRTAIEGSQNIKIAKRMALTPSMEIGIRQDGGDAETGRGIDLGAGLLLADGVSGLAVDIRARRLLVHQAEGFAEHGMSISVSYNPTPSTPLGFSARVSPAWGGDAMSGAEALWGRETMGGMGSNHLLGSGGNRLDTEVGYGLPIGARFVGTPRVGLRTSEYGRDYRIGYAVSALEQGAINLQLGIDAERRESAMLYGLGQARERSGADQRVIGTVSLGW